MKMHGGCVGFSSMPGVGSVFFLWTRMSVLAKASRSSTNRSSTSWGTGTTSISSATQHGQSTQSRRLAAPRRAFPPHGWARPSLSLSHDSISSYDEPAPGHAEEGAALPGPVLGLAGSNGGRRDPSHASGATSAAGGDPASSVDARASASSAARQPPADGTSAAQQHAAPPVDGFDTDTELEQGALAVPAPSQRQGGNEGRANGKKRRVVKKNKRRQQQLGDDGKASSAPSSAAKHPVAAKGQASRQMVVLVVDDSRTNRLFLSRMVRSADRSIQVLQASDGQEGLDVLQQRVQQMGDQAHGLAADLVLLDFSMPRMSGPEMVRAVRDDSDRRISGVPIVGVTGNALPEDQALFRRCGAQDVLLKPVRRAQIGEVLQRAGRLQRALH